MGNRAADLLTRAVSDAVRIPVIAAAASAPEHFAEGVSEGRADAVLAASIFHFGQHTVREAKELMRACTEVQARSVRMRWLSETGGRARPWCR